MQPRVHNLSVLVDSEDASSSCLSYPTSLLIISVNFECCIQHHRIEEIKIQILAKPMTRAAIMRRRPLETMYVDHLEMG